MTMFEAQAAREVIEHKDCSIPPFTGGAETGNNQVQKWWVSPREVGERAKSK